MKLTEKTLEDMIRVANDLYYNETPILDDNSYDILKEFVERKYPKNQAIKEIGAPVEKNKVELPYFMGSMNKTKSYDGFIKWLSYEQACNLPELFDAENGKTVFTSGKDGIFPEGLPIGKVIEKEKPSEDRLDAKFKSFLDAGGWGTRPKNKNQKGG